MSLREHIFGEFDFGVLDDPQFKEDAVREEIIAPLLKAIGYSASRNPRIIRSLRLGHPYVMFGSQKRRLSYIPDYVLSVGDKLQFVLDAKGPGESIETGDNVAQVYSYAIHPEIRAWNYGLCNGRQLALFEVTSIKAKRVFDLCNDREADLHEINQKLNPRTLGYNEVLDYVMDAGTYLHCVMNMPMHMDLVFTDVPLAEVYTVSEGQFTSSTVCDDMADRELMLSFDYGRELLESLLSQLSVRRAAAITEALSRYPYQYTDRSSPAQVTITCKQATEPAFSETGEMFFPFRVTAFKGNGD